MSGLDRSSSHLSDEQLSAYIDEREALSDPEREMVEQHLHQCRRCQQTLAELELVVNGLRTLPPVAVPRTFHLTADIVSDLGREIVSLREPTPFYIRHMGAMRGAAAVAAVIFVFILAADILTNNFNNTNDADDDRPVSGAIERSEAAINEATAAEAVAESAEDGANEQDAEASVAEGDEAAAEEESAEGLVLPTTTVIATEEGAADSGSEQPTLQGATLTDEFEDQDQNTAAYDAAESESSVETQALSTADSDDTRRYFRFAEVVLVIVFTVLLSLVVVLPRLERSGRQ